MSVVLALLVLATLAPGFVPLLGGLETVSEGAAAPGLDPRLAFLGCRLESEEKLDEWSSGRFTMSREELPV